MPRMLGPKPIEIPPPLPWETLAPEQTLLERLRTLPRSRWVILGLSVLMTTIIIVEFMIDSRMHMPQRVDNIIMVDSWSAKRSTADLAADRRAESEVLAAQFAASRAYIATLPPTEAAKARDQYNAYAAALKPSQRPTDYIAPLPPMSALAPTVPAAKSE